MANKRFNQITRVVTSFDSNDVLPVGNGTLGDGKMTGDQLLELTAQNALAGNVAPEFVPNSTTTIARQPYIYGGSLYVAVVDDYTGPWDSTKFMPFSSSEFNAFQFTSNELIGTPRVKKELVFNLTHSQRAIDPDVKFFQGDTIIIRVEALEGSASFSNVIGAWIYADGSTSPATINVVDGVGTLTKTFTKAGKAGGFGFWSIAEGVEYDLTFAVTLMPANYSDSLSKRVADCENDVTSLDGRVTSVETLANQNAEDIGYIPKLDKTINYVLNHSTPYLDPSFTFKAGDKLTIHVEVQDGSDPLSFISGGFSYDDSTFEAAAVYINNGIGTFEKTFVKDGRSAAFGKQSIAEGTEYIFTFNVVIIAANHESTVDGRLTALENQASTEDTIDQYDKLVALKANPLGKIKQYPGFGSILEDIGFIGDSLCSGELEFSYGGSLRYVDYYDISWGQRLCKLLGITGYNFSVGGLTAKGWCIGTADGERKWVGASTNLKKAYIIAMGVNDSGQIGQGLLPLGDVTTDIDYSDYDQNADSFVGWYAGIIQRIRSVRPNAPIFVVTTPDTKVVNPVIAAMPGLFSKVYLIDLNTYLPMNNETKARYFNNNHCSEAGYQYYSFVFNTYLDYIIRNNQADFKLIHLQGTQWE